jgi:DNA-binding MarR family transcriptional regulator
VWPENFLYLLHHSHFLIAKRLNDILLKQGRITFSQFLVLVALECSAKPSQREIADFLLITEATVSRHIESLCKTGLLVRKDSPKSRRAYIIQTTAKGKAELKKTKRIIDSEVEQILSLFPQSDQKSMSKVFEKIIVHLQK